MHHYAEQKRVLPIGVVALPLTPPGPAMPGHTALAQILPFLEQANLQNIYNFNLRNVDPANEPATSTQVSTYVCPSDDSAGRKAKFVFPTATLLSRSNVAVCFGSNTMMFNAMGTNIGTAPGPPASIPTTTACSAWTRRGPSPTSPTALPAPHWPARSSPGRMTAST